MAVFALTGMLAMVAGSVTVAAAAVLVTYTVILVTLAFMGRLLVALSWLVHRLQEWLATVAVQSTDSSPPPENAAPRQRQPRKTRTRCSPRRAVQLPKRKRRRVRKRKQLPRCNGRSMAARQAWWQHVLAPSFSDRFADALLDLSVAVLILVHCALRVCGAMARVVVSGIMAVAVPLCDVFTRQTPPHMSAAVPSGSPGRSDNSRCPVRKRTRRRSYAARRHRQPHANPMPAAGGAAATDQDAAGTGAGAARQFVHGIPVLYVTGARLIQTPARTRPELSVQELRRRIEVAR